MRDLSNVLCVNLNLTNAQGVKHLGRGGGKEGLTIIPSFKGILGFLKTRHPFV